MIYLTGDLHGNPNDPRLPWLVDNLTEKDYLIVLGDFGFYWNLERVSLWNLLNLKYTTFAVKGNHENYDLLKTFPKSTYPCLGRKMNDNTYILDNGEVFKLEDKTYFVFGGALSIDKAWRTPYVSWWPEEQPNGEEYKRGVENLEKVNYNIDYFLAHDVYRDIAKKMFYVQDIINSSTSDMLGSLESEIKMNNGKPYEYFFGHWHRHGQFGEEIKYTCLYTEVYNIDTKEVNFFPFEWE